MEITMRFFQLGIILLIVCLFGCTSEQVYNSTSELRAQQCSKQAERDQADCASRARTSYGQYKKARDEADQTDAK